MAVSSISPLKIKTLLREVEKPGRYMGNEVNSVQKDPAQVKLRVALVFPDLYEMGESHVGLKILYKILNDQAHIQAERVYAPWTDMEQALIRQNLPLFSLESKTPLSEFDIIGITLPYELVYTNILTILERGGVPLWQKDRTKSHPIVIGGGPCAFNPEPIADFFDGVVIGDGEELILKIAQQVLEYKTKGQSRDELLKTMAKEEGVYIPSLFEVEYHEDGIIKQITPKLADYPGVIKATVTNLDQAAYPTAPIVPNINVIHDRIGVEVQRGCVRACRFCQAGYIYRPERQRSPDTVKKIVAESLKNTGQEEVSLLSLSVGDYEPLNPLLNELFDRHEKDRVAISLPATRTETLTPEIIQQIKRVRKTGFTIAPEAGTPRMRQIINKGNAREDLMKTVDHVFQEGWRLIKFYYMCGLPFELESDLQGIIDEAKQALALGRNYTSSAEINVSVSSFVPKPFTPFQWEPQPSIVEIEEKHDFIRRQLRQRGLRFKHHNVAMSYLEGVFSRGDRRLAKVLMKAYELGCRFDEWEEKLNFDLWKQAFAECGLDSDFYVSRRRERSEILPWDHLFIQMKKEFLWEELQAAHDLVFIEDCSFARCSDCGVCDFRKVKNVNYQYDATTSQVTAYSTRRRLLKDEAPQYLNKLFSQEEAISTTSSSSPSLVPPFDKGRTGGISPRTEPSVLAEKIPLDPPFSKGEKIETKIKIRAQFTKLGDAAFLSHLDLATLIKRSLARAKIPVAFSQGFHPMMLLSLGPAQPVGIESEAEFMDIELSQTLSPNDFVEKMNAALPSGIAILSAWNVENKRRSLNSALLSQVYQIEVSDPNSSEDFSPKLEARVSQLKNASEVSIVRRRPKQTQTINIRPFIKDLEVIAPNQLQLVTHFGQSRGSIRPTEVLEALFAEEPGFWSSSRIRKIGAEFEPSEIHQAVGN